MDIAPCLLRCALAFLGRDRDSDQQIAETLQGILPRCDPADILTMEACVRLTELDLPAPPLVDLDELSEGTLQQIGNRRPDLVERIRRVTKNAAPSEDWRSP